MARPESGCHGFLSSAAHTGPEDIERFIGPGGVRPVVVLEQRWFQTMLDTTLYLYRFDPSHFVL